MEDRDEVIIAILGEDRLSRPADKAADSLEGLEKQAKKTGDEVDDLGEKQEHTAGQTEQHRKEVEKTTKALKTQEQALGRTKITLVGYQRALDAGEMSEKDFNEKVKESEAVLKRQQKAVDGTRAYLRGLSSDTRTVTTDMHRMNRELDKSDGFMRRLLNRVRGMGGSIGGGVGGVLGKLGGFFGKIKGPAFFGIKWTAMGFGVSFLATALQGLGAAAIAAVNGLAPLSGMLIAYPGFLAAIAQGFGVFKLATSGMGKAISTLADPKATPEAIQKATKNMSVNQMAFARAVADSKKEAIGLRKELGDKFFGKLDDEYRQLTKVYFPLASKYLGQEATMMNKLATEAADYLETSKTQSMLSGIMQNNTYEADQFGHALGNIADIMLHLLSYAGPMLRHMSRDFRNFTGMLDAKVAGNGDGITGFFNASYARFKQIKRSLTDYVVGIANIVDYSDSLTRFLGRRTKKIGKSFREYTESPEGEEKIRGWFKKMRPIVREIGLWVRDLSKAVSSALLDGDDFVTTSKALRKKVLPWLTNLFTNINKHVVPTIQKLSDSGLIGGTGRVLVWLGKGIEAIAKAASHLPPDAQKLIAFGTGLLALTRMLKGQGIIGGALNKATGGLIGGGQVQRVFVTNWPRHFGSGGGSGSDSFYGSDGDHKDGDPKDKKPGRHRKPGLIGRAKSLGKDFVDGFGLKGIGLGVGLDYVASKVKGPGSTALQGAALGAMLSNGNPYAIAAGTGAGYLYGAGKNVLAGTQDATAGADARFLNGGIDWGQVYGLNKSTANNLGMGNPTQGHSLTNLTGLDADTLKDVGYNADGTTYSFEKLKKKVVELTGQFNKKLVPAVKSMPDGVITDISVPGALDSIKDIKELNKRYGLTPKQIMTLAKLTGDSDVINRAKNIKSAIDDIPSTKYVEIAIKARNAKLMAELGVNGLYTGGNTKAGTTYLTGEQGPEAWISRATGKMTMLGVGGPQLFTAPADGAVIASTATKNPYGGAEAMTPAWALSKYREALSGESRDSDVSLKTKDGKSIKVSMPVKVITAMSPGDIEREMRKVWRKIQRELEERE